MHQVVNVYAIRMAGVFMISLSTIWLRTGLMHRGWAYPHLCVGAGTAGEHRAFLVGDLDFPRLGVGNQRYFFDPESSPSTRGRAGRRKRRWQFQLIMRVRRSC